MNKQILFIEIIVLLLSSCTFFEKTPLDFINQIFSDKKCQIEVNNLTNNSIEKFIIDDNSFIYNNETYYKYLYKNNYQLYNNNLIDNNKIVNIEYGKFFINVFNNNNYNNTYYIENNIYLIYEENLDKFDFSFLSSGLKRISFYIKNNCLIYNLDFEKNKYQLNVYYSEVKILPFNINEEKINNFYYDNQIDEEKLKLKINNKDDFILIIESDNCKACKYSQIFYALYSYEFNIKLFTIEENNIKNLKNQILQNLNIAYNNQKNDYKRKEYLSYPKDYFLTPTAINFIKGNEKYVFLGFSKNDVNAFYKFCNEK